MRKLWLWMSGLALALALTACAARGSRPGSAVDVATATLPAGITAGVPDLPSPVASVPTLAPLPTSEPATCTVSSRLPTPGPTEISLFPGVSPSDWKLGPDGAKVVFIEYSDFQ